MSQRSCPCCEGLPRPYCPDCIGNDGHPPQHCQDCPQLDHVPARPIYASRTGKGRGSVYWGDAKGCRHCGCTGYVEEVAYGGDVGECPACGGEP